MTATERIRAKREKGKTMDQIQVEQNTDTMFWVLTTLASVLFLAVAAWKFFYFQTQISAPSVFWERFLEGCAGGASESFRLGSLIMAYYEAKKGRMVTVWLGVGFSLAIMGYDIHLAEVVSQAETAETYIFLCVVSEAVAVRAVFGYAFEDLIKKRFETKPETSQPVPETKPETSETVSENQRPDLETTKPAESVSEIETPVSEIEPYENGLIFVPGFKNPMTQAQIRSKLGQYKWKLKNDQGKAETNENNIKRLEMALA